VPSADYSTPAAGFVKYFRRLDGVNQDKVV
jgi:hypothetical protein